MNERNDSSDPRAPDADAADRAAGDQGRSEHTMNDHTMNDDAQLDLLLGRMLDRRAAPGDWDAFATLAHARPDCWPQLLIALRSEQGLLRGTEAEVAVAERVELPAAPAAPAAPAPAAPAAPIASIASIASIAPLGAARTRRAWPGWAAAAVLALAWAGSALVARGDTAPTAPASFASGAQPDGAAHVPDVAMTAPGGATPAPGGTTRSPGGTTHAPSGATPAPSGPTHAPSGAVPAPGGAPLVAQSGDGSGPRLRDPAAAAADAEDGRGDIVGELPLQLVSSSQAPDGKGLDVLYVRPVLERARVSGMYSLGLDDAGRPAPVSIHAASLVKAGSN